MYLISYDTSITVQGGNEKSLQANQKKAESISGMAKGAEVQGERSVVQTVK